jgi:fatty-acyl-CoA synthase
MSAPSHAGPLLVTDVTQTPAPQTREREHKNPSGRVNDIAGRYTTTVSGLSSAVMDVALTINDFLSRAEALYPNRVAVIDEPTQKAESWGSITYAELGARARAMAAGLDRLGIGVGDRVAMVSHNSARLLTALMGVCGSGRILVPVNFRLVADEVRYIVEHSGARVLMIDPDLDDALADVTAEHRFVIGEQTDRILMCAPDGTLLDETSMTDLWRPDEHALATINYTSGTTARPKGVQLTHRNLWLNAATFGWQLGVNDRDVYLHTLPQFHCNGWGILYSVTGMGGRHVIISKIDGLEILRRVAEHGVTLICAAPAVANAALDAAASWEGAIPGRGITRLCCAGAPPPSLTIQRIESELGWEFIQMYGLTETSPLVTMNRSRKELDGAEEHVRAASLARAGGAALGVQVRISADGEVLVRGNHVMAGYWEQPDATAEAIKPADDDPDGPAWFHTGDGGYLDDERYLTIADRKKDVIISGGENVSSIEVEDAIFTHPEVREVAVIGVPDGKWGELVLALVVKKADSVLTTEELIAYSKTKLAGYKCPKRVEFRDTLARTTTGKLQKFKLREPYWASNVRKVN